MNIQLVLDNPECYKTLMNHYGWITGAKNYIALVGKKSVENLDEVCAGSIPAGLPALTKKENAV